MSATDAFEAALLALIFNNTNAANVGDATGLRGSTTAGTFWISLHTASPTDAGTQTSSEAAYGSYGRTSIARASGAGGFAVAGTTPTIADNVSVINFPACTSGSETETHFGLGFNQTTAGNLDFWGANGAGLAVSSGITPSYAVGAMDTSFD